MTSQLSAPRPWNLVASGYLEHNLENFTMFAHRALELASVGPNDRVVDVACGPGSLTLPAARSCKNVEALDFSESMLEHLRGRLASGDINNVNVTRGDGQDLPFDDASFDAGFSMFGLMFFPDRQSGFNELRRVLRPGAKAVVSSWVPMNDIEVLRTMFSALFELAPELAPSEPPPPPPMSTPAWLTSEMSAAGFAVDVVEVPLRIDVASLDEMLAASRTSFAALCLIAEQLGDRFDGVWDEVRIRMAKILGDGPVGFEMRALFGVGTAM